MTRPRRQTRCNPASGSAGRPGSSRRATGRGSATSERRDTAFPGGSSATGPGVAPDAAGCHRDLLVVPSWASLELSAGSDLVLFGYSDAAAQQKLGLWREARL